MIFTEPSMADLLILCHNSRDDEIEQYEALVGPWNPDVAANEFWMNRGPKFMLALEEGPLVAGGWMPVIDGVYQSWMVGHRKAWDTHWRSITKYTRKVMMGMFQQGVARRLQTSALEEREKARWWYEKGLKMKYEGTMYGFGFQGQNMVNYALLREDVNHGQ